MAGTDEEAAAGTGDAAVSTAPGDDLFVRRAVAGDHPAIAAFTRDTWGEGGDYVAEAFPGMVAGDGPDQRTFVAVDASAEPPADLPDGVAADDAGGSVDRPEGRAVGVCQAVVCSEHEGWVQAMRVAPDYRGRGLSTALNDAAFRWLRERGCAVARNMVFASNVDGLGGSRAAGFEPATEFRWAHPDPAEADADGRSSAEHLGADAAWSFWQASDARTHLRGVVLDDEEGWALSELTRERLRAAAAEDRLQVVGDDGVDGFSLRTRTVEREDDDGEAETRAEYAVAVWRDLDACRRLFEAVRRDAAGVDADRTRVLVPETAEAVSDAAAARVDLASEPDFVLTVDLTRAPWNRGP